ncbi:MAG: 5-(carboxyamino)imidazole ribonucleotide mutase [Rhodothermaceae bacterium]|nr:5-(carboxyamino)imidazole ribonucleotide mutase [Bacteroidota bacterium]MXX96807.1 5-(carboxyamino)imidazole ribonucleotide mutase [Rhodothermaceae bacterium]MXZ17866.1 5-(carboxyamino)imidazole ribonucleotide mutase [Rhodothermaceae bacterium]MXZ56862.1 5-(carboxyamino)imidazole ribonucleotide mutase [Rhodothermaceae bacterium]MYB91409.1 5-(carboxyamino)imidazole ribonucleotide mutase [Rhodothermaceae bacterium]
MSSITSPLVGILMGSDSDLPVMRKATDILESFDIPFEIRVMSAHRTPDRAHEYATTAHTRGIKVLIAGAGVAAHLAGVLAANTPLPVLGVPINSGALKGLDALLATVQMPSGIPVAALAIDGSKNAALLAVQILATSNATLQKRFLDYKAAMLDEVSAKDQRVQELIFG